MSMPDAAWANVGACARPRSGIPDDCVNSPQPALPLIWITIENYNPQRNNVGATSRYRATVSLYERTLRAPGAFLC